LTTINFATVREPSTSSSFDGHNEVDLTGQRVRSVVLDFAVTITMYEGFKLRIAFSHD
jgi:hypothetical protein